MARRVISLRCNDFAVSEQSGLAQAIRPDSPFWVHAVFRNFTFCGYGLRQPVRE
jgi:hypothetical protein